MMSTAPYVWFDIRNLPVRRPFVISAREVLDKERGEEEEGENGR